MRVERRPTAAVELQIGPMVDVIFLLLVFFMVQTPLREEAGLALRLPGAAPMAPVPPADPQRIAIRNDGQVLLGEAAVDGAEGRELPELVGSLRRFKAACDAARSPARVTLDPDDHAVQQRIADVLNACAEAGIGEVSFAAAED